MVFYFYPQAYAADSDDWLIYMGKDKYENEDLIAHGLPHDVWFHVDDLSSAHVYLRLPQNASVTEIPERTLKDCVQLTKANSIQGSKNPAVNIVYTPWGNLRKTQGMDVGQVSFHNAKQVVKVQNVRKDSEAVNRLNKTKKELYPDLAAERQSYDRQVSLQRKTESQQKKSQDKADKEEAMRQADLKSYKHLMQDDNMTSRSQAAEKSFQEYEEDFM